MGYEPQSDEWRPEMMQIVDPLFRRVPSWLPFSGMLRSIRDKREKSG
jgi:hypothetical protein